MIPSRALFLAAALGAASLAVGGSAHAQSLNDVPVTPAASLGASASQTVGITEMSITYSSPAARERTIWGGLVPYGEVWRAGANAPTRFTTDRAVTIGGSEVAAGDYTLVILPTKDSWTVIFNRDSKGRGASTYDKAEDVARVEVKPTEAPFRERMLFLFDGTTNEGTQLTLEWAGLKAAVPITTDTAAFVEANISAALGSLWRPAYSAGRYLLDAGEQLDRAAELMSSSIAIEANWWNHWYMARIEHERGQHKSARKFAKKTLELGAGDTTFESFFKKQVDAAVTEWPAK